MARRDDADLASAPTLLRRERRVLTSATLTSGTGTFIDFVLPLFAGAVLGLSASQTGVLLAVDVLVSLLTRPFAGTLVDRGGRLGIAAAGATTIGVGCVLFGLASGLPLAVTAAAVSGVGGAFLWVAIRAIVGERLDIDSGVFAKLLSAEEYGSWVVFVPAVVLLSLTNYVSVFFALALCSFAAAVVLATSPGRRVLPAVPVEPAGGGEEGTENDSATALTSLNLGGVGRKLRPMLLAVVIVEAAEAAISLLMILQLQRHFDLEPFQIALIFLPGAIAMSILPPLLHRAVVRYGRRKILILGSVASAIFAAGLGIAPNPLVIAGLWVLSGAAWAAIMPIQQSVIAESVGPRHLGRGLSLYEASTLAGAMVGSLAAGFLYDAGSWLMACLVFAVVILSGAALVPAAVRRLGAVDQPRTLEPTPLVPTPIETPDGTLEREVDTEEKVTVDPEVATPEKSRRQLMVDLLWHTVLFGTAVVLGLLFLPSLNPEALLGIGQEAILPFRAVIHAVTGPFDLVALLAAALRVWVFVYAVDVVWTFWKVVTVSFVVTGRR